MITEHEAWLILADDFEAKAARPDWIAPVHGRMYPPYAYGSYANSGICDGISSLRNEGSIYPDDAEEMLHRLDVGIRHAGGVDGRIVYHWPLTPDGHRARAAFCRQMAAELIEGEVT